MDNKKVNSFLLLFFFFVNITCAQTIKGTVKDSNGNPLNAKIIIKKADSTNIITEFVLVTKGTFFYTLKKEYTLDTIILEVSATGYSIYEEQV
jgi:hypothetical protein